MDLSTFIATLAAGSTITPSRDALPTPLPWGSGSDDVQVLPRPHRRQERRAAVRARWPGSARSSTPDTGAHVARRATAAPARPRSSPTAFEELEADYVHPPPPRDVQRHAPPRRSDARPVRTGRAARPAVAATVADRGAELPALLRARGRVRPRRTHDPSRCATVTPGSINGQKTWSSGARFAEWGELDRPQRFGRTEARRADGVHGRGWTAPGVTIRPIRQMSGGTSFNEVFFSDVRITDRHRLGASARVAGRAHDARVRAQLERFRPRRQHGRRIVRALLSLARWLDRTSDPVIRQRLADVYAHERLRDLVAARTRARSAGGGPPGPIGSIGKLLWTRSLTRIGDVAAELLGPRLTADTGEWGTYAWTGQCSAPRATGSPAVATRSSTTSSATAFSACRPNHESTKTWRSEMFPDEALSRFALRDRLATIARCSLPMCPCQRRG